MEGEKMAYKMMNQGFVKLDKFDGSNFIRWQDKMKEWVFPPIYFILFHLNS